MALIISGDAATTRTAIGLGSASTLSTGTSAGNALVLDGSGKLPAVDGSNLTGVSAGVQNSGYFQANLLSNPSVTVSAWTSFTSILTEQYDVDNYLSGGTYTPAVAGHYYINAKMHIDAGGSNFNTARLRLMKNGTEIYLASRAEGNTNANEQGTTLDYIVEMNGSTDYLTLEYYSAMSAFFRADRNLWFGFRIY